MMFQLVLAATIALSATQAPSRTPPPAPKVSSQQGARDVLGWREARWGMTDEQVAAAFGSELSRRSPLSYPGDGSYIMYDIPRYGVDRDTFVVVFAMDTTSRTLREVDLLAMSRLPQFDAFDRMEAALIRKYGAATSKTQHESLIGFVDVTRVWVFPTTIIELTMHYNKDVPANWLTVRYHPTEDSTTRKL